ncbi:hypothetical protein CY34DRAFT_110421 [Suillus luteus UH-Slu-Lm8-n1]|uniref:Uncharacterized protein n=1 Tax=Suillus luteus UH-Slu-Lm8-n1 TaxID=930992 RepID=A0A0C9ZXE0_9AGAM|nr:hypothetical protein CY34DRAFT_110421 [Suillus luteus UH-Slu-Lm8-n1]
MSTAVLDLINIYDGEGAIILIRCQNHGIPAFDSKGVLVAINCLYNNPVMLAKSVELANYLVTEARKERDEPYMSAEGLMMEHIIDTNAAYFDRNLNTPEKHLMADLVEKLNWSSGRQNRKYLFAMGITKCDMGKHSKLDPYFLPTLKQPMIKDIYTVKAQFQLQTLDDSFPAEAVMCSKEAANTLLYLASICEKNRDRDNREVIPFMRSARNSSTDELHFVVHSDALFPDASESRGDIVPEFSLEDFEDINFTLTGGVHDWTLKDLEDPQGHFKMVIDLYKLEKVPVMVPNVLDAVGNLIHSSEYSKHFTKPMPVAAEVVMRLWTFVPDNKRPTDSRIYQTTLKSLRLLPQFEPEIKAQTKTGSAHADPKGKRKADGPAGGGSPVKKSTGQQKEVGGAAV